MICVFQILVIIFMLIFFGVGVGIVYLPSAFFNGDCRNSTNVVITYANNIYNSSQQVYCLNPGCACALDTNDATLASYGYSDAEIALLKSTYNNFDTANGAHNSVDCLKNQSPTPLSPAEITLLSTLGEF